MDPDLGIGPVEHGFPTQEVRIFHIRKRTLDLRLTAIGEDNLLIAPALLVESAFADMKDPHFLSWEPMFHWTDSKIRVHAFYCVLALILGSLLQRRAAQNGLSLSLQALFKALNGIQEVTNLFPPAGKPGSPGRPHVKTTLTEMDPTQQALFRLFALDRYRQT